MANTADRSGWDAYLFELQGGVHEAFAAEAVYLSELSGYTAPGQQQNSGGRITNTVDGNRDVFEGSQFRHTVDLGIMNSGGWPGESGTWNVASAVTSKKIYDVLCDFVQPFTLTVDVERDSMSRSNADAVTRLTEKASQACAINENIALLGDGTGLVGTITDSATSLATTITGGNRDYLLPGTVWDVLTRSTLADPGQGLRRTIASVSWTSSSAGTITWSTTASASDGGSGSITHSSAEGIYIPGSASVPGTTDYLPNGLQEALSTSGTFQGLSRTTYPQYAGTDGRSGTTTTAMLSESMLMAGARVGRRYGAQSWDFLIGAPESVDGYTQSFFAQRLFNPDTQTLRSGWSGAVYAGAGLKPFPLIGDMHHKKGAATLIAKKEIQLYGDAKGPSFLDDDGSKFRRFDRKLTKEVDLLDRMNAMYTNPAHLVKFGNLDEAA